MAFLVGDVWLFCLWAQNRAAVVVPVQTIPTQGAHRWKSFTIGKDAYLAVANTRSGIPESTSLTNDVDSKIYKWDGVKFVEFQSISTHGACDWESFTIGEDVYLAVANSYFGVGENVGHCWNVDSKIYKWDGIQFIEFQSIPTHGGCDWESFKIGNDFFLVIANNHDESTYDTNSVIYRWNGSKFEEYQTLLTHGAHDWESFMIGRDTYLAVANYYTGQVEDIDPNWNLESMIYKWNGREFLPFQAVPTYGGHDWESFTIGNDVYLAMANFYTGSTQNTYSRIYKWDGERFVEFQSVFTYGGHYWKHFTAGNNTYLALANFCNDTTSLVNSFIYRWDGKKFAEVQVIPSSGGCGWESFVIGNDTYLAFAQFQNDKTFDIDSKIYKVK